MIVTRNFLTSVPSEEEEIFRLVGENEDGIAVLLENKDPLNYISYQFQGGTTGKESSFENLEDNSDNSGTSGTLSPKSRALVVIRETKAFFRLRASSPGSSYLESVITMFSDSESTTFTRGVM